MIPDEPPWDLTSIRQFAELKPDMTATEVGEYATAKLTKTQLRDFAVRYIADWVDVIRRANAREVEKEAERPVETAPTSSSWSDSFAHWEANPRPFLGNSRSRPQFRRWMGDRFDAWYDAARSKIEAEAGEDEADRFASDWHPDGVVAYWRERNARRLAVALDALVKETAETVRLETTRELLSTMFALGDGTEVTWGAASVEQHCQRIHLLTRNASGTVATAARHEVAVRMIEQAGVSCLDEVTDAESAVTQ